MAIVNKPKLSLTGILVQDANDVGYTAFFAEFPEAVAEGETEEEVKINLFEALKSVLDVKRDEYPQENDGHNYITKSYDLELSL